MKFTADKERSLWVLQLAAALFIIFAPTVFGLADNIIGVYSMFLLTGALFTIRTRKNGQFSLSAMNVLFFTLLFYAAVMFLWATNKNDHLVYITLISSITLFYSLALDYFSESPSENFERRMMYLLSTGGVLCAVYNFIYWITELVPFGRKDGFSRGFGNNDFLAVFMVIAIILSAALIKGNSKSRKILFIAEIVVMGFAFVMAKSVVGWFFLLVMVLMLVFCRKPGKKFMWIASALAVGFSAVLLIVLFGSSDGQILKDVLAYSGRTLFGKGGGYWSGNGLFLSQKYENLRMPGVLALLYASSGIIGFIVAVLVLLRVAGNFIRLKTKAGFINLVITLMLLCLPMSGSITELFLWAGLTAWNEKTLLQIQKRTIKKDVLKKLVYSLCVFMVIAGFMFCHRIMVLCGDKYFENGDYVSSYGMYNIAASVNITDSESCRKAALALCEGADTTKNPDMAAELMEKAQSRDKNNTENIYALAFIYDKYGKYDLSAREYRRLSSVVLVNDEYNIKLSEVLYKIAEQSTKGSTEARAAYDEIIKIAEKTEDLDCREQINNIADKTLVFTKGELEIGLENDI